MAAVRRDFSAGSIGSLRHRSFDPWPDDYIASEAPTLADAYSSATWIALNMSGI
jgi:hypothetical protein